MTTEQEEDLVARLSEKIQENMAAVAAAQRLTDQEALLAAMSDKIQAEMAAGAEAKRLADETKRLADETQRLADEQRNNRTATERHIRLGTEAIARYANLAELIKEYEQERREREEERLVRDQQLRDLITGFLQKLEAQRGIDREANTELARQLDDLEQSLYALLTRDLAEMRRSKEALGKRSEIRAENQKELAIHYRNLRKLKEQAAQYGTLNVPLDIQNQIEDLEAKIVELGGSPS